MSRTDLWVIILGGMAVTYATRLSFILWIPSSRLPPLLRRGLRFVPPAVLAALTLPMLLRPAGSFDVSLYNTRLLAGVVASLVAWRTKNTWFTIATGMIALALLTWTLPTGH
jgi:branched-subunit amino acid transport protein